MRETVRAAAYDRAMNYRKVYTVLAGLLLLTVVYQFVTAGLIVFEGKPKDAHGAGGGVAHLWPLLMIIAAAVGKLGRDAIIFAVALLVLVVFQSAIPEGSLGWLHPLGALIIAFTAHHALQHARAGTTPATA
jgi:hypothetical protein